MNKNIVKALQVRFVKLRFTVEFPENSVLPRDKVSAIRGGMGEMLLRMNCVRNRKCEQCDFESECIVQKIMYSKFAKKPEFVTTGEVSDMFWNVKIPKRFLKKVINSGFM